MRVGVALLLALVLLSPTALAAKPQGPGPLTKTLDDHLGEIRGEIDQANETYGPREEFDLARVELARSGFALLNNATLLTEDGIIKASGALATGQARAQAQGGTDPGQQVMDQAADTVSRADALLTRIRGDLSSMEDTGLEPVALDGGLAVAHLLIRAMDMRHQYTLAERQWDQGDHSEPVVRSAMTGAAGALRMTQVAEDTLSAVAQARGDAQVQKIVTYETLEGITQQRVDWAKAHSSPTVERSNARVQTIHGNGEQLLSLAAYGVLFQDMAFKGLQTEYQRDKSSTDTVEIAWQLINETEAPTEAWLSKLAIHGGLPSGAVESARFVLTMGDNATGDARAQNGAYAASLVHLGAEHVGVLQQAFGGPVHEPGTQLAMPGDTGQQDGSGDDLAPYWIGGLLLAVVVAATVRFWRRHT